eukprot:EG_transcript_6242
MAEKGDYEMRNKHYECSHCSKHFLRLGHLYDHVRVTKHMCVRCLSCDSDITTWKERLRHYALTKHALVDGPMFVAQLKDGPCNPQLLGIQSGKADSVPGRDADSEDEEEEDPTAVSEVPAGWWDECDTQVVLGVVLAFRPNGRTTFKSLQKVLQVSYLRSLYARIVATHNTLEAFILAHQTVFNKVSETKLRLRKPREDVIQSLAATAALPPPPMPTQRVLEVLDQRLQRLTAAAEAQPAAVPPRLSAAALLNFPTQVPLAPRTPSMSSRASSEGWSGLPSPAAAPSKVQKLEAKLGAMVLHALRDEARKAEAESPTPSCRSSSSGTRTSGRSSQRLALSILNGPLSQSDESNVGLKQLWEELMDELESSGSESESDELADDPTAPFPVMMGTWGPTAANQPAAPWGVPFQASARTPAPWPAHPQRCLPAGWECRWDYTQGRYYYLDHRTRTSQWDPPTHMVPHVKTNL